MRTPGLRVRVVGRTALLVEVADAAAALSLAQWVRARDPGVRDVVPAARTVLVDGVTDPVAFEELLAGWPGTPAPEPAGNLVEVPVRYDGPDLAFVARHWEMTRGEAVATHLSVEYVVSFCGFAPGFAYLAGLPEHLAVPRLESPRPRVDAGSVAVADTWTGTYPRRSPGGWRILGSTDAVLWDQERAQPALLPPGTRVRFTEVG